MRNLRQIISSLHLLVYDNLSGYFWLIVLRRCAILNTYFTLKSSERIKIGLVEMVVVDRCRWNLHLLYIFFLLQDLLIIVT